MIGGGLVGGALGAWGGYAAGTYIGWRIACHLAEHEMRNRTEQ